MFKNFPRFLAALALAAAWSLICRVQCLFAAETPGRPNVIFIMADDLGYTDLGCFGSQYYETPHLDRLAAQGMKLTNFHQCQNCAPSRAALMTGQYSPRTGLYTVGSTDRFDTTMRPLVPVPNADILTIDRSIVARQLQSAGYVTGIFGKWHLGNNGRHFPTERGFDEAIVSAGRHFQFETKPHVDYPEGTYLADFLTDNAIDFIERHQSEPFFLYLPHYGVHSPFEAKPELIAKFQDKPGVGGHHNPVYAAMIASVDESVGRILQKLDESQLSEKTVVIFTSDNGGVGGYDREGLRTAQNVTDNSPLRSGKGSLYEGGTRVPFIVRWPGVVAAGSSCSEPAINVDFYPTLLELTGASAPEHVLDGKSLVSIWKDPAAQLDREFIFQHFPGYLGSGPNVWRTTPVSVIQQREWKLMEFLEDGHLELYNLKDDLGEQRNLAQEQPEKANELLTRLQRWRAEVQAKMPERRDAQPEVEADRKMKKGGQKRKRAPVSGE